MGTKESLLELERQLWNADEEFYRDTLSADAVMVFPEPTGILERSAVLEALGGADRWRRIKFDDERLVEADDTVVQLVYRAVAERSEDGSEYTAFITTTYVRADGSWRLSSLDLLPRLKTRESHHGISGRAWPYGFKTHTFQASLA